MREFIEVSGMTSQQSPVFSNYRGFMQHVDNHPQVKKSFRNMITAIYTVAVSRYSQTLSTEQESTTMRRVLAAYMIKHFTNTVLDLPEEEGAQSLEARLVHAASTMVDTIHQWVDHWKEHGTFDNMDIDASKALVDSISAYIPLFNEWKSKDEVRLVDRIKNALAALVPFIRSQVLLEQGGVYSAEVMEAQSDYNRLLTTLTRLIGPDMARQFAEEL